MPKSYEIEWRPRATKDLQRLPSRVRAQVRAKVEQYAAEPASLANQVKRLRGDLRFRLRIGDYRVLFRIDRRAGREVTVVVMVVVRVAHRSEAYD